MKLDRNAGEIPLAPLRPSSQTRHGVTFEDPYAWLRADNWREVMADPAVLDPDIADYLIDENDYAAEVMAPLAQLRDTLVAELRGRIAEDDWTVPIVDGPFAYGATFSHGAEHPRLVRFPRAVGEAADESHPPQDPEVLLDANREALDTELLPPRLRDPFAATTTRLPGPRTGPAASSSPFPCATCAPIATRC